MQEKPKLTPREAKKMLETQWGKRFVCPQCGSTRVKRIIKPEYISDRTVTVDHKCKSCGWAAASTLNIVYE